MKFTKIIGAWFVIAVVAGIQLAFQQRILNMATVWEGQCTPGTASAERTEVRLNFLCDDHEGYTNNPELIAAVVNDRRAFECKLLQSGRVDCTID